MKNGQKVLIFDIDGTAIHWSLSPRVHEFLSRHWRWMIFFGLPLFPLTCVVCLFYILRPCNRRARAIIRNHTREGGRAIGFSSNKDICLNRWMIKSCLKLSSIPFDELILCPDDELTRDFKLRIVRERECDILLENERDIVLYIRNQRQKDGYTGISSTNGFFVVRFGDF